MINLWFDYTNSKILIFFIMINGEKNFYVKVNIKQNTSIAKENVIVNTILELELVCDYEVVDSQGKSL